ncbi:hypothetical protein [Paramicrobacterium fandaimingii]|uniref:hypothetical protein n=1 Tax=Paramicrobacterium fandaimingii TaxID=2708079 RepID=UPI00189F588C|nr:hypothetical protein [Microbacterium fandaimingii]
MVLIDRLTSADLPTSVPTHWNATFTADAWYGTQAAFWMSFLPGLIGAILISVVVLTSGDDISRFAGSAGMAGGTFITGGIALTWFSSLSAARSPEQSTSALLNILIWTTVLALLAFALSALPRKHRRGTSGGESVTDEESE